MKKLTFPHFVLSRVEAVFFAVTGGIPETSEIEKADRPYERARDVAKKAVAQCAAVSGTLSLPVGPLGMLTILPDLALVWKIQSQMVVDIAAAFGHPEKVTKQDLFNCLFKHVTENTAREYSKAIPIEHQESKAGFLTQVINKKVGRILVRKASQRIASRLVPLAGAAVVATYSAIDTKEVARNAVELFSGEKLPERHSKRNFPRAEQMFEASAIKEIDSKVL